MSGTPYERGFQHGERFSSKIRSAYGQLLTSSLLPWLNREKSEIDSILVEYKKPLYDDGQFSYQVLLQSGQNLLDYIPDPYIEEMHGVADGAGLPFEEILVLNTFVDTLLAMRSVTYLIMKVKAPQIASVEFLGGVDADGVDNDGDGEADEAGEGRLEPYEPLPHAALVEVPPEVRIRVVVRDPQSVDPAAVRVQLDETVYRADDETRAVRTAPVGSDGEMLEVLFTPPEALPAGATVSFLFQAGDDSWTEDPPPGHARFMRDERIVFTVEGAGKMPHEVPNLGARDDRYQPPSIAFAARGSATADGRVLLAHHFALLDSNVSHKHTAVFVHRPAQGKPHVYVGWTGMIWGFSGMNADGLACAADISDTLDNPMVGEFLRKLVFAKLLATGIPVGILEREMLSRFSTVDEAVEWLGGQGKTFGWNFLLADRGRDLAAVEVDSNILGDEDGGVRVYGADPADPANLDPWGRPLASAGADDLRIASHYQRNTEDIAFDIAGLTLVPPQRTWTTFYFRSLRAFYFLGGRIASGYGLLGVPEAIEILKTPDLVDKRDSMNAAVYEPEGMRLHFAMGEVPATAGPFVELDLGPLFGSN